MKKTLTGPQMEMLAEIRRTGRKTYNGRAIRSLKALEAAGLVNVDWDLEPYTKGSGIMLMWHITATPKEKP